MTYLKLFDLGEIKLFFFFKVFQSTLQGLDFAQVAVDRVRAIRPVVVLLLVGNRRRLQLMERNHLAIVCQFLEQTR